MSISLYYAYSNLCNIKFLTLKQSLKVEQQYHFRYGLYVSSLGSFLVWEISKKDAV